MSDRQKILIFTHFTSPYQIELFDAIADKCIFDITVGYMYESSNERLWQRKEINHKHFFLDDDAQNYRNAEELMKSTDLVIFNYYQHDLISKLINSRANSQQPWCFWGERTGYRFPRIGNYYRKWKLSVLHNSDVPIWGIGDWAVESYRKEFGSGREYFNMPYFSDLTRFNFNRSNICVDGQLKRFLYSGSLIHRKGVDLLASAFSKLADEFPNVFLSFMGDGNMRAYLEKKLDKHRDKVEFLGFNSWENLPEFYRKADILCVPSRHDGWALVVLEGLAAGLPVIGTNDTGATLEFIKNKENGWLIPSNNYQALYDAMKQATMLSHSELLIYSQNARKSVENHSLNNGAEKFNSIAMQTINSFKIR